jgi:4'-phosphopantetheinyl transferase
MDTKPLNLWLAYPDDLLAEDVAQACRELLSEEELARAARFKFDRNGRESIATRALARTALTREYSLRPEAWRFQLNAHGKPSVDLEVAPGCGLTFNVSNSPGLVVCLVGEGVDVGVDVEPLSRANQILEVAPEVFSAEERAQLAALNGAEKSDRALSLWTLKESYIKARGMGLAIPLDKFSFVFGGAEGVRLAIDENLGDDAERWRFCLLNRADHRIAVMVERSAGGELAVWETRPMLSTPERLGALIAEWFPKTNGRHA